MAYTKLWHKIVTSSIWDQDDQTRIVWITMLALANRDGYVESSFKSLAMLARVTEDGLRKALGVLTDPDPDSSTTDDDGRRVEQTEGGWTLLNYSKYREATNEDPHAVLARERQRRHRESLKMRDGALRHVTSRDTASASASASASESGKDEEIKEKKETSRRFVKPSTAEVEAYGATVGYAVDGEAFVAFYESKGWKIGNSAMKSWQAAVVTWKKRHQAERKAEAGGKHRQSLVDLGTGGL